MSKKSSLMKINKTDYSRVVATDTLPYETPLIFSNDGFYQNLRNNISNTKIGKLLLKALVHAEIGESVHSTIPFVYKIRKNATEFRRLSLIHPISQNRIKQFYQQHEKLIVYYCQKSRVSIRAPRKIASSYYKKSSWENIHSYKTGTVSELWTDGLAKHSPSYFSYKGYDRLYKFYQSVDYFDLEKRFSIFLSLDVSKCFDSIYTHSLSWAVKDKSFTKQNVSIESTFPQAFDIVMRGANHNETNGIVIGPEVSRIFSEILFQRIDNLALENLAEKSQLEFGVDFEIRRYVDDVFIFAKSEETARTVYNAYADSLVKFNLHPNSSKSELLTRPFFTTKSRVIHEASKRANVFIDSFLEVGKEGQFVLTPKKIFNNWALLKSFIEDIKSLCAESKVSYDEVSSYLISILFERVKKLVNINLDITEEDILSLYKNAVLIILEALYFLYSVAPSVSSSYKFCSSIILILRFSKRFLKQYNETIKERIYELSLDLLKSDIFSKAKELDCCNLEALNVVLAIKELGRNYELPIDLMKKVFNVNSTLNYFDIVSGLYCIADLSDYQEIHIKLVKEANKKLRDLSDIRFNSEKCYLLLDLLSCPYVDAGYKKNWINNFAKSYKLSLPTEPELNDFLQNVENLYWFINWREVDLLNALEKKELKRAY